MPASDLNNAQNWQLVYQEYKQAKPATPKGGYLPLPGFKVPITLSARTVIARTVSNIPAGKRWRWAGKLRAYQDYPNEGVASQPSEIAAHSLYLNSSKLVIFPDYATNYQLVLNDAFWLRDMQLSIYEFVGDFQTHRTDLLNQLLLDTEQIKSKIDAL
ncbi:MAG: hypothetical protein WBA39_26745 [Rivularia sp. (in: cyanobacteria)]